MSAMIEVQGLSKKYLLGQSLLGLRESIAAGARKVAGLDRRNPQEELWALKDISFSAAAGERIGIIGANGAGKSTLLKILSRVTHPTEGSAVLRGRVGSLLEVGSGFHPELTGRENIQLNGALLGMTRREVRSAFDRIVAFAEIGRFLDTPVKRYSSGMYMRLAFAVAAHLNSEILIIDEVLAVGDHQFQQKCLSMVDELGRQGRTILFVTHHMVALEKFCNRVIYLRAGHLQLDSSNVSSAIHEYLRADCLQEQQAGVWTNPAEPRGAYFHPRRLFISDRDGNPMAQPVRKDAEAWISVYADIAEPHPALGVGYFIFAPDGTLLFETNHTDVQPAPALEKGSWQFRSRIPVHLFNEGTYTLQLAASLQLKEWIYKPGFDSPQITLHIQGGLSDSPFWIEKRGGLLAPTLAWECSPLEGSGT